MDIILYSAKGSNSFERVEWVLDYKGISYQRLEVENHDLTTSYLTLNPYGYVPAMRINGVLIAESMAIIECLEELFPDKPILGSSIFERAKVREVCEYVNSSIHSPQNRTVLGFLKSGISDLEKKALRGCWIRRCLCKLAPLLWNSSNFAQGDSFTVADIFVASIYRKGLLHGMSHIEAYHGYCDWLYDVYR